jgi:cytochrome c biogenesis factor
MKKPSLKLTALQTIALSVFGALLAAAAFILPIHHSNSQDSPGWLLATMLALIIVGFAISFYATTDLESGLLNERWPEDEIISTRALLASSLITAATFLCVIAAGIFIWISHSTRDIGWALLLFVQSLTRLQTAAKPPRPNRSTSSFTPNWNSFSPIRSEHWGER